MTTTLSLKPRQSFSQGRPRYTSFRDMHRDHADSEGLRRTLGIERERQKKIAEYNQYMEKMCKVWFNADGSLRPEFKRGRGGRK